jgi:hypothetical protein
LVNAACQGEDSKTLNAQQLKEVMKGAQSIARFCRKHLSADTFVKCWNLPLLEETYEHLNSSERFKKSGATAGWKTLLAIFTPGNRNKYSKKGANEDIDMADLSSEESSKKRKQESQGDLEVEIAAEGEDSQSRKPKRKKIKHKKTPLGS